MIRKPLTSVDLFSGLGGLALGAELAGFTSAVLIDHDEHVTDLLKLNQKNGLAFGGADIITAPVEQGSWRASVKPGSIDLLTAGPPCQPFSQAGKSTGSSDARNGFPTLLDAVRFIQPRAIVIENVPGLFRADHVHYADYIRFALSDAISVPQCPQQNWQQHLVQLETHFLTSQTQSDYKVIRKLVNAADFGVPQLRTRVFYIAYRADVHTSYAQLQHTHSQEALETSFENQTYWEQFESPQEPLQRGHTKSVRGENPWQTVRNALHDLPALRKTASDDGFLHFRIPGARSYRGHSGSPYDWPAKTLKAGSHGIGGGENTLRHSNGRIRYFSLRECARLQTIPDSYQLKLPWTRTMAAIGNAVPVRLGEIVCGAVHDSLLGEQNNG